METRKNFLKVLRGKQSAATSLPMEMRWRKLGCDVHGHRLDGPNLARRLVPNGTVPNRPNGLQPQRWCPKALCSTAPLAPTAISPKTGAQRHCAPRHAWLNSPQLGSWCPKALCPMARLAQRPSARRLVPEGTVPHGTLGLTTNLARRLVLNSTPGPTALSPQACAHGTGAHWHP